MTTASEKPRHDAREAGLVITADLCPVKPGLSTGLSASLPICCNVRAAWPIGDQHTRVRLCKPCPRPSAQAATIVGWRHAPSTRYWSTRRSAGLHGRSAGIGLRTPEHRSHHHDDERQKKSHPLSAAMSRVQDATFKTRLWFKTRLFRLPPQDATACSPQDERGHWLAQELSTVAQVSTRDVGPTDETICAAARRRMARLACKSPAWAAR